MTEATYTLRVERTLDAQTTEEVRAAGLTVPTLDDGSINEFVATVDAPRMGLAITRALVAAGNAGMVLRGHFVRFYDAASGEEVTP